MLPQFDVTIDSPKDFSAKDGKVKAIIRSKYTYGKLVKGEAIVSLTQTNVWSYDDSHKDNIIKSIKIDGKGSVEFDTETDLKLDPENKYNSKTYQLKATVIDGLTGRNQSQTKEITIHSTRYSFDHEYASEFSPGLPVSLWVRRK